MMKARWRSYILTVDPNIFGATCGMIFMLVALVTVLAFAYVVRPA